MTSYKVWSERQEGSWYACTYAAYLTALVIAGHQRWPLGAFTNAERWAFEASQTIKPQGASGNFTACDQAAANRYGPARVMRTVTDLRALLATPGLILAVAGLNARLVARLRHWQPAYADGHAAAIMTLGPAGLLWLDPMAPMGYAGEPISAAELLTWWNGNPVRYLALRELTVTTITKTIFPSRVVSFAPGTYRGYDPATLLATKSITIGAGGSSAHATAHAVFAPTAPWGAALGEALLIVDGGVAGCYVPTVPGLTLAPAPPPPAADCTTPVANALAARDLAWRTALNLVKP